MHNRTYIAGILIWTVLIVLIGALLHERSQLNPRFNVSNEINLQPSEITRVYDGDTFYVTMTDMPPVFGKNIGVRIVGIDTPEMRSSCPTEAARKVERKSAHTAKKILEAQLRSAKVITLEKVDRDKYFRILAQVKVDGVDVTKALKDAGVAVPYYGARKEGWCK